MIAIIITGHGQFASAMDSALQIIAGKQEAVICINFDDDSILNLETKIQETINTYKAMEGILVLSDLVGGTPFKIATECAHQTNVNMQIIGGVNLPMILEVVMARGMIASLEDLVRTALCVGKDSIKPFHLKEQETVETGDGI